MAYRLVRVDGVANNNRRQVFFLEANPSEKDCNALDVFGGLKENEKRYFLSSFGSWIDGLIRPKLYHRWDKSEHSGEFVDNLVFRKQRNDQKNHRRFHGCICHPIGELPRCEVCVLVKHVFKKGFEVSAADLRRINAVFNSPEAQRAIRDFFTASCGG